MKLHIMHIFKTVFRYYQLLYNSRVTMLANELKLILRNYIRGKRNCAELFLCTEMKKGNSKK